MSFLNPLMLAGLGAIAAPIIIHLLNRHRVKRVVWAAMRFLQVSVEHNQRRMHIEDWLLLFLRCLLLILLALALARPTFESGAAFNLGHTSVTGVIILDNSYSMGATDGVQSRFERARKYAETIVDALPSGSMTAVFLASDIVRGVIPEPTRDLNLVRKVLREAPLTDRGTRLGPALKQAVDTLTRRGGGRQEIYLISDAQASGWTDLPDVVALLQANAKTIRAHLIFINDPPDRNLGVSEFRLASGLTPVDEPLRFEVQITNFGHTDASAVPVRLRVDGEPASDQAVIDSLPAGASKSVSLFTKIRAEGYHAVIAEIPADRLAADDQRALVVDATRRLRVLLVDGRPSRVPRDSETFYLRNALAPVDPGTVFYIEPVVISPTEFATTRLDEYQAVILANVSDFGQSTTVALEQYLQRGGGLIVFPGDTVNVSFYNQIPFLPAKLGTLMEAPDDDHPFHLQAKNYEHSITVLWNDPGVGTLASARFFKAYPLQPATNAAVVASFADHTPAIVERPWGQGRVLLFASTANTAWNDLPVRPAFIPLLYRSLGALWQQKNKVLNLHVGDRFEDRLGEETLGKDALISFGDKDRQFRRVELVNGRPTLISDETDRAGVYSVDVQTDPPLKLKFATQADARESRLDPLSAGQLAQLGAVADVVKWQPDATWNQSKDARHTGGEIWRALVVVALLVAVAETVFGQRFSEPK